MNVRKVATGLSSYINKSPRVQKVLRNVSDNPGLYATIGAVIVGTTARPALTLAISPNKRDGIYSASSSIASSVMELIGGVLMLNPMKKAVEKSSKNLYNTPKTIYHENKELLRNYKSVANRVYKWFTFPITSAVRFAMVAPIATGLAWLGISKSNNGKTNNKNGGNLNEHC